MSQRVLRLSREGIFPITRDLAGRPIGTATGIDHPGTIQGEGKLCGVPSLFVRLQGCNLRCRWQTCDGTTSVCDTAHTWAAGGTEMSVDDVLATLMGNMGKMRHVVITGGEPLLQPDAVTALIDLLRNERIHTTIETNGLTDSIPTSMPDLMSISPKLSASGLTEAERMTSARGTRILTQAALSDGRDVQLKFVVCRPEDADEIKADYADSIALIRADDIIVMPLGANLATLSRTRETALKMAIDNGWRYGPRLHIDLFGNKEGT